MPEPYYQQDGITIYCGRCEDVMPHLPGVDLVFFDPPYGLNIAKWDKTFDPRQQADMAQSCLNPTGSLYATCSSHILSEMMAMFHPRRVIAWGKPNLPLRKHLREWEWSTEFVLWVTASDDYTFNKPEGESSRDYWRIAVENGFLNTDGFHHPAKKPMALLRRIIAASSNPGDVVLDPFMGSGTTLRVAKDLGRRAIGIEMDECWCERVSIRLQQAVLPLEMVAD